MKKITLLLIALCLAIHIKAQGETLKELVAEGNKAYVEFVDVKKNIPEAQEAIHNILVGEEWNRWQLVDSKEEADFILKVSVEKKGLPVPQPKTITRPFSKWRTALLRI